MEERVHILGIRHHGPGSAALLREALDALDPECVLIEGPPEANELIRFAAAPDMKPPVALLLYAMADASASVFFPFAEYSPEWQAMLWALGRRRPVRFIDLPAGISIRQRIEDRAKEADEAASGECEVLRGDPLDELAAAAGYSDSEAFWNALVEQSRLGEQQNRDGSGAIEMLAAVAGAMSEARSAEELHHGGTEDRLREAQREAQREAWMRLQIRASAKEFDGTIAVVTGAWHVAGLRSSATVAADKALVKDLPKEKVEATWVPWTDGRLSGGSGYRAGVVSPGWYRHLWELYQRKNATSAERFVAEWQARTAALLRDEGFAASTASAIEATRLALALAAMRGIRVPGLEEMREAALAALCHGEGAPLQIIERKLYVGERVGEIDEAVPQMPLARDLALWQKKTRLKPEDIDSEIRLDLRSEAGLLKSTLLHRLTILNVPWGELVEADTGRGTFREAWKLRWEPELSVRLAEALIHGATIESAAAHAQIERAGASSSVAEVAGLIRNALVADLSVAAQTCIARLQALAVNAAEINDLMQAVAPLADVLRYGAARKMPEQELRALAHALAVEVNAGIRLSSHNLDEEAAALRAQAMRAHDEALRRLGDAPLLSSWQAELGRIVEDSQVAPAIAGVSLRRLHEEKLWPLEQVAICFSFHTIGENPQRAGAFLESFLGGGAEVLLADQPLLSLLDEWLCSLGEPDFIESLPLLCRAFGSFDSVARRRVRERVLESGRKDGVPVPMTQALSSPGFEAALPLLFTILGFEPPREAQP
jgi:hypothetical protein